MNFFPFHVGICFSVWNREDSFLIIRIQSLYLFDEVRFISFFFHESYFWSMTASPSPRSLRFSPMFSSKSFIVLPPPFTFKAIIHCELNFGWVWSLDQGCIFAYEYLVAPAPFVEKVILPSLACFCIFVRNRLSTCVWVYFWALHCVPLICVSLFMPAPHCLVTVAMWQVWRLGSDSFHLTFIFQNYCSYFWFFAFVYKC